MDKLLKEGFNVAKENDKSCIMREDLYYGLLTNKGPFMLKNGVETKADLSKQLKKVYSVRK